LSATHRLAAAIAGVIFVGSYFAPAIDRIPGLSIDPAGVALAHDVLADLAAKYPDKLKQLQKIFAEEARKYNVFPLDNRAFARSLVPRPSATAGQTEFTYHGEISGISPGTAPPFLGRSFTMTANIDVPQDGAEGMLVTDGGQANGYGLYLLKGKPVFTYNLLDIERWEAPQALGPSKHTVVFDFTYDGPGLAKGGTGVLKVDGAEVATRTIPHTIAFTMPFGETFDVGIDTRTGVNDDDYHVPFRFTGTIDKLTVKIGPEQFTAIDRQKAAEHPDRATAAAQIVLSCCAFLPL
jgi:hypothetical protein